MHCCTAIKADEEFSNQEIFTHIVIVAAIEKRTVAHAQAGAPCPSSAGLPLAGRRDSETLACANREVRRRQVGIVIPWRE